MVKATLQRRYYWQRCVYTARVLVFILVGLTSCISGPKATSTPIPTPVATPTTPLPTKPPPPEGWELGWLKGIPCRPPCWEGITPGQTTAAEAVEMLKNHPWVATTRKFSLGEDGAIAWKWVNEQEGGEIGFWSQPPQVVFSIRPGFPRYFRFSEVIEAYGEPSHIIAMAYYGSDIDGIFYELEIVYRPQGFILKAIYSGKPDLTLDTLVSVTFFAPEDKLYLAAFSDPGRAVPWQGFKGYDFYCRNRDDDDRDACHGNGGN